MDLALSVAALILSVTSLVQVARQLRDIRRREKALLDLVTRMERDHIRRTGSAA
jgi:hypothetical protein